ncbi:CHC2 zinc finger domain-containing protein [Sphingomonas sp. ACRSK]|uniref:CHC2 zinc finger domain-containing protein n=1 Tax=Sphingomonas sp. ACRSK TaxID=2918213 RepID=UPI001EF6F9E1|nr:CHC2 zinc finger domain-containing protein [Sphingomonas sp. ACRSK]MCG7346598.1 CHC2 zinc finger domain-containing protein [Sphingomonas sp. ACRSK]
MAQQGRGRLDDAEFRRRVDELKERHPLSGVVGRAVKLKRAGREHQGLCPFHPEKSPSFYVNDAKGFYHCFGCSAHGDVVRFVMEREGCTFREAYRRLANDDLPTWTPQERAKAQAEDRLEDLAKEQDARRFYADAMPVAETEGRAYFRARGITIDLPDTVRFGMVPSWRNKETGEWGRKRPAIICGAQDGTGAVVGIQRIFFKNDNPALGTKDCKLSLGTIRGSALRLEPPGPAVILAEGPEDGLSLMQEGPGLPVWVPFGTSMMPAVVFPPEVRRVFVAGQNNTAGRVAANKAAISLSERGLEVRLVWPAATFDDWNDQLRGAAR